MPNFEGAQKQMRVEPAETFDEKQLKAAAALSGDLELTALDNSERILIYEKGDPVTPKIQQTTERIYNATPDKNIYLVRPDLVDANPENIALVSAETETPFSEVSFGQEEKAVVDDIRFDHYGEKALTSNIRPVVVPPRKAYVPPPAPKSFLKRLFGG